MSFVQLIEYETSNPEQTQKILDEWKDASKGKRTAARVMLGKDRDNPQRYCELVFFDSYEAAMENSDLPETREFAAKFSNSIDGEPTYFNLDVVDDDKL